MELSGSQTEKNLEKAYLDKVFERNRSVYYADIAERSGRRDIASLLRSIAHNETEQARKEFNFFDRAKNTQANLESVLAEREEKHTNIYPAYAATAREEGFDEIADFFEGLALVEDRHRQELGVALDSLTTNTPLPGLAVQHSAVTMAQLVMPNQTNMRGFIHGGEMMKLMDNAAGVVALRHSRRDVVTARVDEINFLKPVKVGDLVLIDSALSFVSSRSMEVRVQVYTEAPKSGVREKALTAYFIMVALDADSRPAEIPPLLITSEEEERLFAEGKARYEAHKHARQNC
jgi:acyl-CoA hydrolase/rubrerythrin